jgi:hypothetical protein
MFDFVRFVAKRFMRLSETTPPNTAGTPSSLAAIRRAEFPRSRQARAALIVVDHPVETAHRARWWRSRLRSETGGSEQGRYILRHSAIGGLMARGKAQISRPVLAPPPILKSSRSPRFSLPIRFRPPFRAKRTGTACRYAGWDDAKVVQPGGYGQARSGWSGGTGIAAC